MPHAAAAAATAVAVAHETHPVYLGKIGVEVGERSTRTEYANDDDVVATRAATRPHVAKRVNYVEEMQIIATYP